MEKADREVVYMKTDKAYERTYGWSWFLKLHQELQSLGELEKVIMAGATLHIMNPPPQARLNHTSKKFHNHIFSEKSENIAPANISVYKVNTKGGRL